jgi:16S rRNA (uracil1498-N3)-methyltransferase
MTRRFHDPQAFTEGVAATLSPGASHHIARVLRMQVGDELVVFNGEGGEWSARIESVSKQAVTVLPLAFHDRDRAPALAIHLGLPLIKGDRMDYALQKAVELGAVSISLVNYQRNEVRLNEQRMAKKREHWQGVIVSACEQCGLNRLPVLHGPVQPEQLLGDATDLKLVAHPGENSLALETLQSCHSLTLLTGPEGGFDDQELALFREAGARHFALGERVLRAETAPVALMAALYMARGGW